MNNFLATSLDEQHLAEFRDSAIAEDIAALNFRSFDGEKENELDEAFTLLVEEPDHNNNGTLVGKSQNNLANTLRSGGWIFEGYKGVCVKPNSPRKVKDENWKEKDIKYESPRGQGKLQLLIPRLSVRAGLEIVTKLGEEVEREYRQRIELLSPEKEDPEFWDWYLEHDGFIIITEGAKKACSLVSNGYPAIALNGMWGWGTNIKDMFGNVDRDAIGKSLKTIHPDLELFLDSRELVLALDREADPNKVKMVEMTKASFVRVLDGEGIVVTDLKWTNGDGSTKGIDDYIAAKGVKALNKAYSKRSEIALPLLSIVGMESGGLHLLGDTSQGKTTLLKVAYSVVGGKFIQNWRSTANGLEAIATAHNHILFPIAELGQAEKAVGEAIYMLGNERGKTRMTKQLTNRKPKTWQLLFLSSGEIGLGEYMTQAGVTQKGGQEVRMPSIPAVPQGSPFGVFETIHGCDNSKEFAENLEAAF